MLRLVVGALLVTVHMAFWSVPRALAQKKVDVELVLLADASGSIDPGEHRFQREGYATAIVDPQVLAAIARGIHRRIAITYVEWADDSSQDVVVPWTIIDSKASAEDFARRLMPPPRRAFGSNAIGAAIAFGERLIETNDILGDRKVIDFSADSANSWSGISIEEARRSALAKGIVINGLPILCRDVGCGGRPIAYDLEEAFKQTIIGGPGAFVVTADGRTTFAEAVRRKLVLELSGTMATTRQAANEEKRP